MNPHAYDPSARRGTPQRPSSARPPPPSSSSSSDGDRAAAAPPRRGVDPGVTKKSRFRGVSWNKRKRTWQAVHRADGVLRSVPCACERDAALMYNELVVRYQHNKLDDDSGVELLVAQVSCLLCTVTFHANRAHSLTRSP